VNTWRQRNPSLGGSCSSVVGGSWELLGVKTPTYPDESGITTSPKGGTFVTKNCLPFSKGVALPVVLRGRGIYLHPPLRSPRLNSGAVVRGSWGSWELLGVKPPPTPMNRGLQPPPREELLSQKIVSLFQRELLSPAPPRLNRGAE